MMPEWCPRCFNPLAHETDQDGPRLYCRWCAYQLDLLVPPPAELEKLAQVPGPSTQWGQGFRNLEAIPGPSERRDQAHNVAGIRARTGKRRRRQEAYYGPTLGHRQHS